MRVLLAPGYLAPEPGGVPLLDLGVTAPTAAQCLAAGWKSYSATDALTILPLMDGSPGSGKIFPSALIRTRKILSGADPLGEKRGVELLSLRHYSSPANADVSSPSALAAEQNLHATGYTWFLDAASLLALPADRQLASVQAQEGNTCGLGEVLAQALLATAPGDTLILGLTRSAVHDAGQGLLAGLGGEKQARELLAGRELIVALADALPLAGVGGAGNSLTSITTLNALQAQAIDRRACANVYALLENLSAAKRFLNSQSRYSRAALSATSWGSGAGGGASLVLCALGGRALPGARVIAQLLDLKAHVAHADLVITAAGDAYSVLPNSIVDVLGTEAGAMALPAILVAGHVAVPRSELAGSGISAVYALEDLHRGMSKPWCNYAASELKEQLKEIGARLARTWAAN